MTLRSMDFKSIASASSATAAFQVKSLNYKINNVRVLSALKR